MKLVLCFFLLSGAALAQTKGNFICVSGIDTVYIPFMYLDNDTLDYMDGGSGRTEVIIDTVFLDQNAKRYFIKGRLEDGQTGESFGPGGDIFLGNIALAKGKTWIGETETGIIVHKGPHYKTDGGVFEFYVDENYTDSIIFTALGYQVVDLSFPELLEKYYGKDR